MRCLFGLGQWHCHDYIGDNGNFHGHGLEHDGEYKVDVDADYAGDIYVQAHIIARLPYTMFRISHFCMVYLMMMMLIPGIMLMEVLMVVGDGRYDGD